MELGISSTRKKKTPLNNPEEKHCHDGNPRQAEPFRTSDVRWQAQRETEKIGLCFDICSSYNDCYLHKVFKSNIDVTKELKIKADAAKKKRIANAARDANKQWITENKKHPLYMCVCIHNIIYT